MNATIDFGPESRSHTFDCQIAVVDPLDHDMPEDDTFTATRRALCRVATVAAEAGARFQREGVGIDPMAWMLAPRRMFDGAAPIDACLARGPFLRGLLVHGLALDLDLTAEEVDDLLDGDADELDWEAAPIPCGRLASGGIPAEPPPSNQRLFTATVVSRDPFETVHAFHASLAVDEAEIAGRLFCRMGAASADAVIVEGFDATGPMVEALVAPAIADMLMLVAADPMSPLAAGLDLNIEQRFYG